MRDDDELWEVGRTMLARRVANAQEAIASAAKGEADGIHDLRVAIRKVRASLSILRGTALDGSAIEREERDLKELFEALGGARDDDVLLGRLQRIARAKRLRGKALERLENGVARDRKKAKRRVKKLLARGNGERVLDALLTAATKGRARLRPSGDPNEVTRSLVRHVAASTILARLEAVLAYEVALPAPAPVLHRLRVAIKKLRYALDFFTEAMPPSAHRLDAVLARAQDELGDLHDHTIATELVERADPRRGAKKLRELREAEDEEAERLLRRFEATWAEISRPSFRRALVIASLLTPSTRSKDRIKVRRAERTAAQA